MPFIFCTSRCVLLSLFCDFQVLGNHEFDNGIEGVVPYLEHLEAPVVTANIIDDDEPSIQGLYEPSIVVEKNGRRIGIIGVIIASTNVSTETFSSIFFPYEVIVRRHTLGEVVVVVTSKVVASLTIRCHSSRTVTLLVNSWCGSLSAVLN